MGLGRSLYRYIPYTSHKITRHIYKGYILQITSNLANLTDEDLDIDSGYATISNFNKLPGICKIDQLDFIFFKKKRVWLFQLPFHKRQNGFKFKLKREEFKILIPNFRKLDIPFFIILIYLSILKEIIAIIYILIQPIHKKNNKEIENKFKSYVVFLVKFIILILLINCVCDFLCHEKSGQSLTSTH